MVWVGLEAVEGRRAILAPFTAMSASFPSGWAALPSPSPSQELHPWLALFCGSRQGLGRLCPGWGCHPLSPMTWDGCPCAVPLGLVFHPEIALSCLLPCAPSQHKLCPAAGSGASGAVGTRADALQARCQVHWVRECGERGGGRPVPLHPLASLPAGCPCFCCDFCFPQSPLCGER